MKKFKSFNAWLIIDNRTGQALLTEASPHIFWLESVAQDCIEKKWGSISLKKVKISEVTQ